jgi:hypothetical protein
MNDQVPECVLDLIIYDGKPRYIGKSRTKYVTYPTEI